MKKLLLGCLMSMLLSSIYAQNLTLEWARSMGQGTNSSDAGEAIAVDPFGNVYSTGVFNGTVDFDPGNGIFDLTSIGMTDIYIQKLSPTGNFIWAVSMGGISGQDKALSIAVDALGNCYTTGYFQGTVDFDPDPDPLLITNLTSGGATDIFIQKLDAIDGSLIWVKQMVNTDPTIANQGESIAVDALGNCYTTGYFSGTVDFNPDPLVVNNLVAILPVSGNNTSNAYIHKLDVNGNFAWVKQIVSSNIFGSSAGIGIALDLAGNVYTTGRFQGMVDLDPADIGVLNFTATPSSSPGNVPDIYVQKLAPNGSLIWAKQMGGPGVDQGFGIAVDANQNVYSTGYFHDMADFDPSVNTANLTSLGGRDIYIQKLDVNGDFQWVNQIGGIGLDHTEGIAVESSGDVYSTGYFQSTVFFNSGSVASSLTSRGGTDYYIQKIDANGNSIWVDQIGNAGHEQSFAITVDDFANLYLTGAFTGGPTDFDPSDNITTLTSVGGFDSFVQKLSRCVDVNLGPDLTIPCGTSVNLDATIMGFPGQYSYSWSPGIISTNGTVTVTPTVTTNYSVTVKDNFNGCSEIESVNIIVIPLAAPIVDDMTLCDYFPFSFQTNNPIAGTDVYWSYRNSNGVNQTVGPADPINAGLLDLTFTGSRTYQVYRQDGICTSDVANFTITIPRYPAIVPQAIDITLCSMPAPTVSPVFNVTSLSSVSFLQYELYDDLSLTTIISTSTSASIAVPLASITGVNQSFWIAERTTDGCLSSPIQVLINYTPGPSDPVVANGAILCEEYHASTTVITISSSLVAGGQFVVEDINGNMVSTGASPHITIPGLSAGVHVFTVYQEVNGCRGLGTSVGVVVNASQGGQFPEHFLNPYGLPNSMAVMAIANDELDGSVYVTGWFDTDLEAKDIDQNGSTNAQFLTSVRETIFIAKYNVCGENEWLHGYGARAISEETMPHDIVVGPHGEVYVTGQYTGVGVDFSGTAPNPNSIPLLTANNLGEAFVMRVDANGVTDWAISSGSKGNIGSGVTVDDDNVYIIGRAFSRFFINQLWLNSFPADEDYYVASLDQVTGGCNWIQLLGLDGNVSNGGINESIGIDDAGVIHMSGSYSGAIDFAPIGAINTTGNLEDIFLASLVNVGASANLMSITNVGIASSNDLLGDMVVAANGNTYLTGSFTNSTDFGGGTVITGASEEAFIAGYDPLGMYLWDQITTSPSGNRTKGTGIGLDMAGHAYMTGRFNGSTLDFNGVATLNNSTSNNFGFMVGYSTNGSFNFAQIPMAQSSNSSSIPVDLVTTIGGTSYYAGEFTGEIDFHPSVPFGELSAQSNDGFLAKIIYDGTMTGRLGSTSSESERVIFEKEINLGIYPNPTSGFLNIEIPLEGTHTISYTLCDLAGRPIESKYDENNDSYATTLHLNNLKTGVYLLKIKIDERSMLRKIVLEK